MDIVVRAAVVFFFLWLLVRAMGRRELGEMTAFELVILVVLGDLVQQSVTQQDYSVTAAVLAVGTMAILSIALSYLAFRSKRARSVIDGRAAIVVRDGVVLADRLRVERVPVDELEQAARKQGIGDLSLVRIGLLESDGVFSFVTTGDGRRESTADGSGPTAAG